MAQDYITIITDIGAAKIAAAVASGALCQITEAAVGDGTGAYYYPTSSQIELRNEVWRGLIVSSNVDASQPDMINVRFIIPPEEGGFTVREAALYDDNGAMLAVCNLPDTKKEVYSSGTTGRLTITMHIVVTDTRALIVEIHPELEGVTQEQMAAAIEQHDTSETAHSDALAAIVDVVDEKVGTEADAADSAGTTLFSLLKYIAGMFTNTWTTAKAALLDMINNDVVETKESAASTDSKVGIPSDIANKDGATVFSRINYLAENINYAMLICQQTLTMNINNNANQWAIRTVDKMGMAGMMIADMSGIDDVALRSCRTFADVIASSIVLEAIFTSPETLGSMAAAPALLTAIISPATLETIIASPEIIKTIATSPTVMEAVASSPEIMKVIIDSTTAVEAILNPDVRDQNTGIIDASPLPTVSIPTMTSNTTPSGVVRASSVYEGRSAFWVFDGDDVSYMPFAQNSQGKNQWVSYQFTKPIWPYRIVLRSVHPASQTLATIKDFKIQVSNDGANFIDVLSAQYPAGATSQTLIPIVTGRYTYIRLLTESGWAFDANSGNTVYVNTLQIYGK